MSLLKKAVCARNKKYLIHLIRKLGRCMSSEMFTPDQRYVMWKLYSKISDKVYYDRLY